MRFELKHIYDQYAEERKNWKYRMPKKLFLQVIKYIFFRIYREMFEKRLQFRLPVGLGWWSIEVAKHHPSKVHAQGFDPEMMAENLGTNPDSYRFVMRYNQRMPGNVITMYSVVPVRDQDDYLVGSRGLSKFVKDSYRDPAKPNFQPSILLFRGKRLARL